MELRTFIAVFVVVFAVNIGSSLQQQQRCVQSLDIIMVVDGSNSLGSTNFELLKTSLTRLVDSLAVNESEVNVGVVLFSRDVADEVELTGNRQNILDGIRMLDYPDEQTRTDLGLDAAIEMFKRGGRGGSVPRLILLVTDGAATERDLAIASAQRAKDMGIVIYAVGVTKLIDQEELELIASQNDQGEQRVFLSVNFTTLEEQLLNATYRACVNFEITTPMPTTTKPAPPPVPACFFGTTDIWLVVDVSSQAEMQSRESTVGDFNKLQNGLLKMIEVIQDPSVDNPGVRLGLITYSDTTDVTTNLTDMNSVNQTALAVSRLPGIVGQGGSNLVMALQRITLPPVMSDYRSYVAIVAPEASYMGDMASLEAELTRLKGLGYTIVILASRETSMTSLNVMQLQSSASGSKFFYNFQGYQELEAATKNFTRDRLCDGGKGAGGLCANSGHRDGGVGVVPHPMDCDKYIQCYYNPNDMLDLGVVRHCPMGLHYNAENKTCSKPCEAECPYDHCKEECEPYKMHGACGAYWECEDGMSKPKCCQQNFAFVPGVGCQLDFTCKDYCGPEKWCGMCQKKPNWNEPSGYDVTMMGGHMWMPRPCFYEDFDIVDCDCTAPRDHACPADRMYDFSDSKTMMGVDNGMKEGIRVSDIMNGSMGITLGDKSAVHVKVNPMNSKNEPFTVMLKFREMKKFSPYGETIMSSGLNCGYGNSLLVSANDKFIFAEIRGKEGRSSTVKVPTHGLNKDEFKSLVLSYDSGMLALSIKDSKTQYIAQSDAPAGICFSCGLDLGAGLNKLSFAGEVQKIAVYSCSWPILY